MVYKVPKHICFVDVIYDTLEQILLMLKQKEDNFMKKYAALFLVILLFLSGTGCTSDPGGTEASPRQTGTHSEPPQTQTPSPSAKLLLALSGSVSDGTMQTLTVKAEDGHEYTFEKNDAITQTGKDGIIIGCPVTVFYYGTLNDTESMQNVEVEKITVSDVPVQNANAQQILDKMSLEEKVGQMFFVRCPKEDAVQEVSKYKLGGYILFARDFKDKTKKQVTANIKSYQDVSKLPMLIGVDEEGGTINRISLYPQFRAVPFWSPQDLFAQGGWELIISDTIEKANFLKALGVNLNMAPVCDVSTDPADFIYRRSFGKDAQLTAQYVRKVVETMNEHQMGSVLKHFPGYGNNKDTHTGIAHDARSYQSFESADFLPFISGMDAGAGAVLVSHNIVACMDPDYPASLSPKVHQILREKLGFDGIIMTDDLYMQAIRQYTADREAAVLAVLAGNDILCCTDYEVQIPAVIEAVGADVISPKQIDASVLRILKWKIKLGILDA